MNAQFLKCLLAATLLAGVASSRAANNLEIYWVDVEGGGATLIVTPLKESVLIDTGWPTGPSAARINEAARLAGVTHIDHLVITHFHVDHYGGTPAISRLIPIGAVYDNGAPKPAGSQSNYLAAYQAFKSGPRQVIQPGDVIPLKQPAGEELSLRCLGTRQQMLHANGANTNAFCLESTPGRKDNSDDANSVVLVLNFGSFRFFDGADLTWNTEASLVCPDNPVGVVDLYQTDHHGNDFSNNPLLLRSLAPTVSVMNNGSRKGGSKATVQRLREIPSIQAMFQLHRNVTTGKEDNTEERFIANLDEKCAGNDIKCSVAPDGRSYTISIPATGFSQTYQTRPK